MMPMNGSSFGRVGGLLAPVPGRHREHNHLGHRPRVNPEPLRRLAMAQSLNLDRMADPSVELHALHPPPPADFTAKGYLPPDFCSGATEANPAASGQGFCLRRLHLQPHERGDQR